MDVFWSALPIVLLIVFMGSPRGLPSTVALPLVAGILLLIKLFYFGFSIDLVGLAVMNGLLSAWTPISIVFGAIFLFVVMELTGSMEQIRRWIASISKHKVAQLMLVGWAFPFLVEGASGFGTPAALAAPILVGLGFSAFQAACFTLVTNTVSVSFGAVGTPIWYGFGDLALAEQTLWDVGASVGLLQMICSVVIPGAALLMILPRSLVLAN